MAIPRQFGSIAHSNARGWTSDLINTIGYHSPGATSHLPHFADAMDHLHEGESFHKLGMYPAAHQSFNKAAISIGNGIDAATKESPAVANAFKGMKGTPSGIAMSAMASFGDTYKAHNAGNF